jgi:hypothetical protein
MTAEPHPALRTVPADGDVRGETIAAQWEPQHQFVGALLWHTANAAAPLIERVPATAITDPLTRWTYEVITGLADGRDPQPSAALHRAKSHPASQALRPDRAPTQREFHRLATHLIDLYTRALNPGAAADHAHDVLDDAYRHAVHAFGVRLQYLTETCTDTGQLCAAVNNICGDLHELHPATLDPVDRDPDCQGADRDGRSQVPDTSKAADASRRRLG